MEDIMKSKGLLLLILLGLGILASAVSLFTGTTLKMPILGLRGNKS